MRGPLSVRDECILVIDGRAQCIVHLTDRLSLAVNNAGSIAQWEEAAQPIGEDQAEPSDDGGVFHVDHIRGRLTILPMMMGGREGEVEREA